MNNKMMMRFKRFIACGLALAACAVAQPSAGEEKGPFEPTWESLSRKVTPQWFCDAKFGIWAHWGPPCVTATGGWNARDMYLAGRPQWKHFRKRYGHQSEVGFKDVLPLFKAEKWDPERLVRIYKEMGAQYVVVLGNHHDNFDLWDSKYQPWNSVNMGPKRDILAGWAAACRKEGLPFGISFHGDHAYMFYEGSQSSDRKGPRKGVPYDGVMTKADGKGKWWEGLDPQDLYEQHGHKPATVRNPGLIHQYWHWGKDAPKPPAAVMERFYKRTIDALDRYQPDIACFDTTQVPFWPISDVGLKIAAHYYNASAARNGGEPQVVMSGKILPEDRRRAITWDIERGAPDQILKEPWLTSTCIGNWHYNAEIYRKNSYKSAAHVIRLLADIVSKNGRLLLSIPLRAEGTFDEKEMAIIDGIGKWMKTNGEAIRGTRPWAVFGEGPSVGKTVEMRGQGFNEDAMAKGGQGEVRFTRKGDVVYAILLDGRKAERTVLRSFAKGGSLVPGEIASVEWLGGGAAAFTRDAEGLKVERGDVTDASMPAVLKITLAAKR